MLTAMKNERTTFEPSWREVNDMICPRRARFFISDVNKGDRRNRNIIDSTATLSLRTLVSGMVSGITSPAREWRKLTTEDPDLAEYGPVKGWLEQTNSRMSNLFTLSNFYSIMPMVYKDMSCFATAGIYMEEDLDTCSRFYSMPVGSFWIANDETNSPRTMARQLQYTVRQIVLKFGNVDFKTGKVDWTNISDFVKCMWLQGNYEVRVDINHVVHFNHEYNAERLDPKYKKFRSCYYESGGASGSNTNYLDRTSDDKYLRESGYNHFPGLFPKWATTGEDVYGTDCPGFDAIGDVKQLQHGERKAAKAIDKMVDPPMQGPTELRNQKATILPGDITFLDMREGMQGFKPTHEVNFRLDYHEGKQEACRQRIRRCFYEDLFLMLSQSESQDTQRTAREIQERHEEKFTVIGPMLENMKDFLDQLVDNQFDFMLAQGYVPPPPDELQGLALKVEYVSPMAQAQKLVGIENLERLTGFAMNIVAQTKDPTAIRKINMDKLIDTYADRLSIESDILYSDEEMAQKEAEAQKAAQQQAAVENISSVAGAAKDLSGAQLTDDSALKRIVDNAGRG
jgi:hypothetical protein